MKHSKSSASLGLSKGQIDIAKIRQIHKQAFYKPKVKEEPSIVNLSLGQRQQASFVYEPKMSISQLARPEPKRMGYNHFILEEGPSEQYEEI